MAAPRFISDLAGTIRSAFRIGVNKLANDAGNSNVLTSQTNAGVDAPIAASHVHLNALSTAYKTTIKSPDALVADVDLTLPGALGADNQALVTTAAGVLSWATVATGANTVYSEDVLVSYVGGTRTLAIKTIPALATVQKVMIQVDTVFDSGTPVPNISVGRSSGTPAPSIYLGTTDVDLTTLGEYEVACMEEVAAQTDVAVYFTAGTSPTPSTGSALVTVWWSVPG